jgi:hypothetical protein
LINVSALVVPHASAAMTLDTYADLFDSDLDSVAESVGTGSGFALTFGTKTAPTCANACGGRLALVRSHVTNGAITVHRNC